MVDRGVPRHPLRVVHVGWMSTIGGGELFLVDLASFLDPDRVRCEIFCLGPGGRPAQLAEARSLALRRFPKRTRAGPVMFLRLTRALAHGRPDVVHLHGDAGLRWGLPAARLAGLGRIVALSYRDRPDTRRKEALARRLFRLAPTVVAGSADVQRYLIDVVGIAPERTRVIPCGIDPEPFRAVRRRTSGASRVVLLSVGRLVEAKGHAILLHALRRLVDCGLEVELHIVGDGPLRGDLERLVARLELGGRVRFFGAVLPPVGALGEADVFVFPSLVEPQGLAVLEAMAAGVPVVASRAGGIPEMIEHARDGILVEPGDASALAAALADVLADPSLRARLTDGAARRVEEFDIRVVARRWEALYADVAAHPRGEPVR
jgi:glycosyltransferase involved in cell wall biosynthesis